MRKTFLVAPRVLCAGLGLIGLTGLMGLALSGCGGGNNDNTGNDYRSVVCTQEAEPAFIVTVTDASTGAPLAGDATVVVTDGSFLETLKGTISTPQADGSVVVVSRTGVFERAGTYTVQVSAPGYAASTQSNLVVTKGVCHVNTRTLNFALSIAPTSTTSATSATTATTGAN